MLPYIMIHDKIIVWYLIECLTFFIPIVNFLYNLVKFIEIKYISIIPINYELYIL